MLTREHRAAFEFANASQLFTKLLDDGQSQNLVDCTNAVMIAINCFGQCELFARQAERSKSLKAYSEKTTYASKMGQRQNDKGLKSLAYAQNALKLFREEIANDPAPSRSTGLKEALKGFSQDVRDMIADYEIKASDVEKIQQVLEETLSIIQSKGEAGLFEHLEGKMGELDKLRKGQDRGAIDNIPWWKIVAIAVVVGLSAYAIYRCVVRRRRCSEAEEAALVTGIALAVLVVWYC